MPRTLVIAIRCIRLVGQLELIAAVLLVFFIVAAIALQVVFRYVFESPLIWVEEAATISFIWVTLLGSAVASKLGRHIYIATFGGMLPVSYRLVLEIFGYAFVLVMASLLAWFALGYIVTQNRSVTVSLPINIPRGFVFAVPTVIAMASIAATQLVMLLDSVIRLRRREFAATDPVMTVA